MMQRFGIEIRKMGDTKNLYNDVDLILSKHGMGTAIVSDEARIQSVAHALNKMMKSDKWFDVCTVKNCSTICGICIPVERMNIYQSIHCVHWNEMLPDFRQLVVAMVLDDFRTVLCPE